MRHLKSGRKLNRTASHRRAMLANLATSLLDKERVRTTVVKAKEVRSVVERLITYGKKGTLHAIRLAERTLKNKDILKKLFNDIAVGYKGRQGGYTRVIKLGTRKGDNADMAIIELVGRGDDVQRKRKKKKKSTVARKPKAAEKPLAAGVEEKKEEIAKEAVKELEVQEEKDKKKPAKKKEAKKKAETKVKKAKEPKVKKTPKAKKSDEAKAESKEKKKKTPDK